MYMYMYLYLCMCIYMHIYMYMCMLSRAFTPPQCMSLFMFVFMHTTAWSGSRPACEFCFGLLPRMPSPQQGHLHPKRCCPRGPLAWAGWTSHPVLPFVSILCITSEPASCTGWSMARQQNCRHVNWVVPSCIEHLIRQLFSIFGYTAAVVSVASLVVSNVVSPEETPHRNRPKYGRERRTGGENAVPQS